MPKKPTTPKPTQPETAPPAAATDLTAIKDAAAVWTKKYPEHADYTITTQDAYDAAAEILANLNSTLKEMEKRRMDIARPIQAGLTKLKAEVDATKAPLEAIVSAIKRARADFRAEQEALAAKDHAEATARHEAEVAAHAAQTGSTPEQVAAILPPPPTIAPTPTTTKLAGGGSVTVARIQAWSRVDGITPPWSYRGENLWMLDEAVIWRLRRAAGDDCTLAPPGIHFYFAESERTTRGKDVV